MRLTTLVRARALVRPQGRSSSSHADPIAALRETVESIWRAVAQAAPETALLARRELVRRETCKLSAVIRGGVAAGAVRAEGPAWGIEGLALALVPGACAHWGARL